VIVGAGHAGGATAALLRQFGWAGAITLIGEEPVPPYQRPPLSKESLRGDDHRLALRPIEFYEAQDIELSLSTVVVKVHPDDRTVELASGELVPYDHLVLGLGARARQLSVDGSELDGVCELRTVADLERLKAALGRGRRLVVVGAGYIGLEVAASARALGADVEVIEREARVLPRVASTVISDFFHAYHEIHDVELTCRASVEAIEGEDGKVTGVRLADGRSIACDVVLIGVGVIARDELAREAGLACGDGINVDLNARTSDPHIHAVGDCTCRPLPLWARVGRLESVPNALEQAKQAAADICEREVPPPEVPWFWSDQYETRLQIAGLAFDAVEQLVRGDVEEGHFAVFHLAADGTVQAVEAVNSVLEFKGGQRLIGQRTVVDQDRLADVTLPMRELVGSP
jgi:3-phenylpropionate/trans-cinnamate dioxygenase ferredoxin reductase subunit